MTWWEAESCTSALQVDFVIAEQKERSDAHMKALQRERG